MSNFVLAITGPTGSGKSTVGEKLAKELDKCVNTDADHIKHMIVGGFYKDESSAGGWGYSEWALAGESIGLLTRNFLAHGFNVIINGYIDPPGWREVEKIVPINHKVLLLPSVDKVISRDSGRREDIQMGETSVREHHNYFSTSSSFKNYTVIDTTDHSLEETVEAIKQILTKPLS